VRFLNAPVEPPFEKSHSFNFIVSFFNATLDNNALNLVSRFSGVIKDQSQSGIEENMISE
jgi:methionyl-tRNA synthetase